MANPDASQQRRRPAPARMRQAPAPTAQPSGAAVVLRTIALMLIALLVGCVVGALAYPHLPSFVPGTPASRVTESLKGAVTVGEDGLDAVLGTYTVDGKDTAVTVRDAILESTSLEAARNANGSYNVPSADTVLAVARNRLLEEDARNQGLSVSEEEVAAYAAQAMGTDDFAAIAASYQMEQGQAHDLMTRSALIKKLRDTVVTGTVATPAPPTAPEAGQEDVTTAEYGQYVIALLGDEWDAAANTWAREDGAYREPLRDYTISNDGATYSAALVAYAVAQTQQAASQQELADQWTAYANQVLAHGSVSLSTLVA